MTAPTAPPAADAPLAYRLLSGPDDGSFCARVSAALADGYVLYGSPALAFDGGRTVAAQAVILPAALTSSAAGTTNTGSTTNTAGTTNTGSTTNTAGTTNDGGK